VSSLAILSGVEIPIHEALDAVPYGIEECADH
jgi:hypothetical protein